MAAKKTTKKRVARKAASKKRRSTKAPSKAQLAARAKFAAAAKARLKKAAKKRTRNKTVIVKPKRVLVINPKKKAAKKRNGAKASPKAKQIRKDFTGMESKKTAVLLAPKGTPTNLAKLGKLILIKTERGTIKPPDKGTTWLCADTKGKLHIATSIPYDGSTGSFGEVTQVEYETAKPHLGYKSKTIFFHKMGEEGGRRPTLSADKEGLRFRGGSYKITRQGIVD